MYCVQCGAELPNVARYCWRCGRRTVAVPRFRKHPLSQGSRDDAEQAAVPSVADSPPETSQPVGAPDPNIIATDSWQYRSARGLATAITVLAIGALVLFSLDFGLALALALAPSESAYQAVGVPSTIGGLLIWPVIAILIIIWTRRTTGNLAVAGVARSWGTGWAIGGWFIPVAHLVLPILVISQAYKATDPALDVPVAWRWKMIPSSATLWAWWVTSHLLPISVTWPSYAAEQYQPISLTDLSEIGWISLPATAVSSAAVFLTAIVVWRITLRQDDFVSRKLGFHIPQM